MASERESSRARSRWTKLVKQENEKQRQLTGKVRADPANAGPLENAARELVVLSVADLVVIAKWS